jgi:hypothetical protein
MSNLRLEAIARQEATYSSGKPCRRGHDSLRYSSNGMCVECLRLQRVAASNLAKVEKAKRNLALGAGLRDRNFLVRVADVDLVTKFTEILQFGNATMHDNLRAYVDAIHATCPNPRALTRDDLAKLIELRPDGMAANPEAIPQAYDDATGKLYAIFNGYLYLGDHVAEVLQGKRLNVAPTRKQHAIL